jgi:hypothetical protein
MAIDWNECIPFEGKEKELPTGANMPPAINVLKLIKSWTILDAESDGGAKTGLKAADLKPGDVIIGAEPNLKSLDRIVGTYGSSAFEFEDVNGKKLGIQGWIDEHKTNPFEVLAIMRKLRELQGPGVHF